MTSDDSPYKPCEGSAPQEPPVAGITAVLQAVADPVRLAMLRQMAEWGEARTCGEFRLPVSKSTLSHHFRVLREAGLIEQRCDGTRKWTRLRREETDAAYPGLLDAVLPAGAGEVRAAPLPAAP